MILFDTGYCQVEETKFRVDKLPATDDMVRLWARLTGFAGAGFKQEKSVGMTPLQPGASYNSVHRNLKLECGCSVLVLGARKREFVD